MVKETPTSFQFKFEVIMNDYVGREVNVLVKAHVVTKMTVTKEDNLHRLEDTRPIDLFVTKDYKETDGTYVIDDMKDDCGADDYSIEVLADDYDPNVKYEDVTYVTVSGGVVQNVFSNHKNKVIVIDHDDLSKLSNDGELKSKATSKENCLVFNCNKASQDQINIELEAIDVDYDKNAKTPTLDNYVYLKLLLLNPKDRSYETKTVPFKTDFDLNSSELMSYIRKEYSNQTGLSYEEFVITDIIKGRDYLL